MRSVVKGFFSETRKSSGIYNVTFLNVELLDKVYAGLRSKPLLLKPTISGTLRIASIPFK